MENKVKSAEILAQIMELTKDYYKTAHQRPDFIPGISKVPYSGRVYDDEEMRYGVESMLQFWLTSGPYAFEFESTMRNYFKSKSTYLVNSGSSANLVMVSTLCSNQTENKLKPGDEIITPAVTFPTTLTPILQNGLVPVFVDCKPGVYNIDIEQIEKSISSKTRCIFIPHTVGIPCDLDKLVALAEKYNLFLLEDGCDALGATWDGQLCGTFGDMSSISFYPAHHMTMGEGGMVVVNNPTMSKTALSIRDWGRDCWCEPGKNNTCGSRFDYQLGDLPHGYDHKYIYSNLGYNLKVTDMQAALGCAQFKKLPMFIEKRRENAQFYLDNLLQFEEHIQLPIISEKARPSWFGFPITLKKHIDRKSFISYLEEVNIETRLVFGGNILKQPGFKNINCRIPFELNGTDEIMNQTFFIGVYPGLSNDMLHFVLDRISKYLNNKV
jgi:CDP-6-deoxy-D-xylo-4-hexulose-3-dehydrase